MGTLACAVSSEDSSSLGVPHSVRKAFPRGFGDCIFIVRRPRGLNPSGGSPSVPSQLSLAELHDMPSGTNVTQDKMRSTKKVGPWRLHVSLTIREYSLYASSQKHL